MRQAHQLNLEERGISRRTVLRGAAATIGTAALGPFASRAFASSQPKITIVGAGISGLNAALKLNNAGLRATVYEGSNRIGGRIYTGRGIMGSQLTTEIGGEFIDSGHKEMRRLAKRYNLDLLDLESPSEQGLDKAFYFDGHHKTEAQIIAAFQPVADRIAQDQNDVVFDDFASYNALAAQIDNTPLSTYLHQVGASGFLYELLNVAYLTEYGCETDVQSALNLVFLLGTDTHQGFEEFGVSDQRYKVSGGNDQIPLAIANELCDPVVLGRKLVAIRPKGQGFKLTFDKSGGGSVDVDTDFLLLTIPFSTLRDVDIRVPIPTRLRHYIDQCGYGTNSKLILGFDRRYWRDQEYSGLFFTDLDLQSGWDSSQLQLGQLGSLTIFTGGQNGLDVAQGSAAHQRDLALPQVNQIYPGAFNHDSTKVFRFIWPRYPWTKGSYTCFSTGQYTAFSGASQPVGNMYFAGEHCSFDFQGYMEGGAVTGKEAAKAIALAV
jgi:monoamine oxidase